jgi:hypothetical protein
MSLIGWYAKIKLKHTLAFIIFGILIWLFFFHPTLEYSTTNNKCFKDNCTVLTAFGKGNTGGDCFGKKCKAGDCRGLSCVAGSCFNDNCIAGNCIGENCVAGACKGEKCKAGDCYGVNCKPGESVKTNGADGRPYDIQRNPLYNYTRILKNNSYFNANTCNTNLDNAPYSSMLKPTLYKTNNYYYGWQYTKKNPMYNIEKILKQPHKSAQFIPWTPPSRKDGEPIIDRNEKIIGTLPEIFKGPNCQWCGYYLQPNDSKLLFYLKNNALPGFFSKPVCNNKYPSQTINSWEWIDGSELNCYPRDIEGFVIPCNWHLDNRTQKYTYQHNMVPKLNNIFQCTICKRQCTYKQGSF